MLTRQSASNSCSLVDYWRFTDEDNADPRADLSTRPVRGEQRPLFARASMNLSAETPSEMMIKPCPRDADNQCRLLHKAIAEPGTDEGSTKQMRLFISGSALLSIPREWHAPATPCSNLRRGGQRHLNPYDGERVPGAAATAARRLRAHHRPETGKEIARDEIGMIGQGPRRVQGLLADA
jgi:malonyl-CoA/methylmalonyl-CoA synthetase